ncbi:MAG TPA: DUF5691 domain-containing protein [Gemmatimonadales bacterium]|nr:DUF5691 domain-containing protein [Gemmatimonadales bacterium]
MTADAIEDPLAPLDLHRLARGFALGSARGGLDAVSAGIPPLTLLTLLGQRLRFGGGRIGRVIPTGRRLPSSPTPIASRAIRVALLRLADSTTRAEPQDLVLAAVEALGAAGLRLHPFDLPRLAPRLAGGQDWLGPVERAYLSFGRTSGRQEEETTDGELSEDNWAAAPKPRRLEFIRSRRLGDPDGARALIERSFAGLRAPVRAELAGVLELRLSPADRPFLETIARDRAPSVREAGEALLSRLPGTEAYDARLREALAMVTLPRAGMLKLRRAIRVEPPKLPDEQVDDALRARFHGVPLGAILLALDVSPADLEGVVRGADRRTTMCLLWAALGNGDLEHAGLIAETGEISSLEALRVSDLDLSSVPADSRRAVIARFLDIGELAADGDPLDFTRLRRLLGGPLAEAQARRLLDPDTWKLLTDRLESLAELGPHAAAALVGAAAALIPAPLGPLLRERLEPLPSELAPGARRFAEVLTAISRASATMPDPPTP